MYKLAPGIKSDPVRRWALPDRVFFAAGACHILAYAFLTRYSSAGFGAVWIRPSKGHTGNHIFVRDQAGQAFDYHGYVDADRLLNHFTAKAQRYWPGWSCRLLPLPNDVLVSEAKSKAYDGLWLREPGQFLHDAMPRAERFLDRFPAPAYSAAS